MKLNGKFQNYSTRTAELANGLRVIHLPFPSQISYCGIAVNTGSRDEYDDEQGMAHFVEHLLFKGTKKRRAHHIISRMENVGGELNAYTTKEETFIYSAFLGEYFERAMELLSDVVFNSEFPEKQIEKEREVILDEINSYIDSPAELIFDDFENLIFQNHDLGHYILGTPELLEEYDAERINEFYRRQYQPKNMVLFSFGKLPFSKVLRLSEKYFNVGGGNNGISIKERTKPQLVVPQQVVEDKGTAQTHVVMGAHALSMFDDKRFALSLMNNILGSGVINSRLNNSLREKNGLVYQVESIFSSYTDTGLLAVYFACDKKNVERCVKLTEKEFERMRDTALTPAQLATAKRQYKGQMGIASEYNETVALRMAKSFLHHGKYSTLDELFERVDKVTAEDIQAAANETLASDSFFKLSYK